MNSDPFCLQPCASALHWSCAMIRGFAGSSSALVLLQVVPCHLWQPWVPHVTISTQDAQGRTLSSLPAEKKHHIDICLAQSLPNYRAAGVEPLQPPRKQKQARTLWARSMHIVLFLFFTRSLWLKLWLKPWLKFSVQVTSSRAHLLQRRVLVTA